MRLIMFTLVLLAVLAAAPSTLTAQESVLTVVTHDSFAASTDVIAAFEAEAGVRLEIVRLGDAGSLVNQAILTRDVPLGDVLYGVDNTFLSRAVAADIFLVYESPALADIPAEFIPDAPLTPIDYGDVCLNYDAAWFAASDVPLPTSLADLTLPEYRGLLVTPNPATSSPGLAFLLTTVAVFGDEGEQTWRDYWADLVANDVLIVEDWTTAYFGEFSGSADSIGTRPLVVSYASSPPVEVFFMDTPPANAPTGAITAPDTCFRQIEYAGVLRGTDNAPAAQAFIDFMLSEPFQADLPLSMFVYPVLPDVSLPDVFTDYVAPVEAPVVMDAAEIEAGREAWIAAWTESVLR